MTYISLGEFDDYPAAESFTRAPLDEYKGADHIETECSKTRMCKKVIEQFCVESSAHQLQWKVEKVKVDTQSSTSHGNQANKTLAVDPKMLQHTGTLYTLCYTPAYWPRASPKVRATGKGAIAKTPH